MTGRHPLPPGSHAQDSLVMFPPAPDGFGTRLPTCTRWQSTPGPNGLPMGPISPDPAMPSLSPDHPPPSMTKGGARDPR